MSQDDDVDQDICKPDSTDNWYSSGPNSSPSSPHRPPTITNLTHEHSNTSIFDRPRGITLGSSSSSYVPSANSPGITLGSSHSVSSAPRPSGGIRIGPTSAALTCIGLGLAGLQGCAVHVYAKYICSRV